MDALLLSTAAVAGFSVATRTEILSHFGLMPAAGSDRARAAAPAPVPADDGPPDLTVAMVRKLTKNPRTLSALRVIAASDGPDFHMKDVIAAVAGAQDYMDLRGIWSAITRRTRAILGDSEALLIWWNDEGIYRGEKYVDHIGRVSPITHQSLKAYFGL